MHGRLLPCCLFCVVLGILLAAIDVWWLQLVLGVGLVVGIVLLWRASGRQWWLPVLCLLFVAVGLSCMGRTALRSDRIPTAPTEECSVEGRICQIKTDETGRVTALVLDNTSVSKGKLQVAVPKETDYAPFGYYAKALLPEGYLVGEPLAVGDLVNVQGTLTRIAVQYNDSYTMHLVCTDIDYTMQAEALTPVGECVITAADKVRGALLSALASQMQPTQATIVYAMLTGQSGYVPTDVLQSYRMSGIAHLLAVSGLHIGILTGLLLGLAKRLKLDHRLHPPLLIAVLGVYCWICGGTPSVLRASIVAVYMAVAKALGRRGDSCSALCGSALVLLCIKPWWLWDVSFVLSYAAFGGIVLLYRPLHRVLARKLPDKLAGLVAINVVATVSTLPTCMSYFGGIGVLTPLYNLVLTPLVSTAYAWLFVAGWLSAALRPLSVLLVVPDRLLYVLNTALTYIGSVGYSKVDVDKTWLPLYYAGLACLSGYCLYPKRVKYAVGAVLIAAWLIGCLVTGLV